MTAAVVVGRRRRELTGRTTPELTPDTSVATDEKDADAAPSAPGGAPAPPAPSTLDVPEASSTRLSRLRRRLAGSNNVLAQGLLGLLSRDRIDEQTWEDFEDTLITSDLGVGPTQELVTGLRRELAIEGANDPRRARESLRSGLLRLVDPTLDRTLRAQGADGLPAVILVVGVNGTGKTTTIGKLSRVLVADGRSVILGAADTFRAAAADQLETWGGRVGVPVVRGPEGGDPQAVRHEGAWEMEARVIDYVRRPPALVTVPDAYAFFVSGTSMIPEHRPGDLRFVHPYTPPRQGDSVVIQARYNSHDGIEAFLAHYDHRNGEKLFVTKLNPAATVEFDLRYVQAVHRVLTMNELFGV